MAELFSNLGIDAKILAAQIINFAILLLLLQKFAYKPVIGMLNKRREEIEKANQHSSEIQDRMSEIESARSKVLNEARKESNELIKKAEVNAVQASQRIVEDAKEEARQVSIREQKKLESEREKLRDELRLEIGDTVVQAIDKTLGDVLNGEARERLVKIGRAHV